MKLEFQEDLLKFLVQTKDAKRFLEYIEPDIFDLDTHYTVFGLLKSFTKKYGGQPNLPNLLEYFNKELKHSKEPLSRDVISQVEETIRSAFDRFDGSADFIREVLIEQYQIKLMKNVFVTNSKKLKDGDAEVIKDVFRQVSDIKKLGDDSFDEEMQNRGEFLLKDHREGKYSVTEGEATYLKSLNRMTATLGFYSPQLVVFMGAPKSFKTGTLLNLAVNYVRDGYKVYYADCENGQDRIRDRARQAMLEATWDELVSGELNTTLTEMVGRYKAMGGDFKADFFPAHTKSIADIEAELEYLRDEFNWTPDIICYDYLDLFKPIDYRIKEKRLQIQAVYFDAIRLQKKWGMIGLSLSQVNRNAVNKDIIDMTGFAEDFGKAANVHAAFALCRSDAEREGGVMRIVPVVQRDGVAQHSHAACFVEVDEARMTVKEITAKEWDRRRTDGMNRVMKTDDTNTKKPTRKVPIKKSARGKDPIKDE